MRQAKKSIDEKDRIDQIGQIDQIDQIRLNYVKFIQILDQIALAQTRLDKNRQMDRTMIPSPRKAWCKVNDVHATRPPWENVRETRSIGNVMSEIVPHISMCIYIITIYIVHNTRVCSFQDCCSKHISVIVWSPSCNDPKSDLRASQSCRESNVRRPREWLPSDGTAESRDVQGCPGHQRESKAELFR